MDFVLPQAENKLTREISLITAYFIKIINLYNMTFLTEFKVKNDIYVKNKYLFTGKHLYFNGLVSKKLHFLFLYVSFAENLIHGYLTFCRFRKAPQHPQT